MPRQMIPGLVLFRWDAPLFFANAEFFKERILDAVTKSPSPVRWVMVAAEPVTSVDVTAADTLADVDKALLDVGIELRFAELKDPVKDKLQAIWPFLPYSAKKNSFRRLVLPLAPTLGERTTYIGSIGKTERPMTDRTDPLR